MGEPSGSEGDERIYQLAQGIVEQAQEREQAEGQLLPMPEFPGFSDDERMSEVATAVLDALRTREPERIDDELINVMTKFQISGEKLIDQYYPVGHKERGHAQVALSLWRARLLHRAGWVDSAMEEVAPFFEEDTWYPEMLFDMRAIASSWLDKWKEKRKE